MIDKKTNANNKTEDLTLNAAEDPILPPTAEDKMIGFDTGEYPYETTLSRKEYEADKAALQVELLKVQHWVQKTGQKLVLLFEGRDAAGKGGTIKRFTKHLPTLGEIVLYDQSWVNRAGVERVMNFCKPAKS